jgi:hypothetical protein
LAFSRMPCRTDMLPPCVPHARALRQKLPARPVTVPGPEGELHGAPVQRQLRPPVAVDQLTQGRITALQLRDPSGW